MTPLFFGESDRQLFGYYHEPNADNFRDASVLLCNPIGFEYEKAHNVIRQMAIKLSDLGYHVLRFDYFATGDSSGFSNEFTIDQCINDVSLAYDELFDMSSNKKVSIIGMRFGALIAAHATQNRKTRNLILWDPILDGKSYLNTLKEMQVAMLSRHPSRFFSSDNNDKSANELIGYKLPANFEKELSTFSIDNFKNNKTKSKRLKLSLVLTESPSDKTTNMQSDEQSILYEAKSYHSETINDWYSTEGIGIKNLLDPTFEKVLEIME